MRRQTLTRSAIVGIAATLADLATLTILVSILGLRPEAANLPALLVGVLTQFVGNKYYAFANGACDARSLARQGTRFILVEAGALILNAIAFHFIVALTPVPYPIARLIGSSLVYFAYSYPLWGRIFSSAGGLSS
jgi:putative flippase GtrA